MKTREEMLADWIKTSLPKEVEYSLEGIETDINVRWEAAQDHHPESKKIMHAIAALDYAYAGDGFCWKTGGDGDNGETVMYLLDIYFEAKDKAENGG